MKNDNIPLEFKVVLMEEQIKMMQWQIDSLENTLEKLCYDKYGRR